MDYRNWKNAVLLKNQSLKSSKTLDSKVLEKILNLKNSMNKLRTNYEGYLITYNMISKY
jgi:hypothetical protein